MAGTLHLPGGWESEQVQVFVVRLEKEKEKIIEY